MLRNESNFFWDARPRADAQVQRLMTEAFRKKNLDDESHFGWLSELIQEAKLYQPRFLTSPCVGLTMMRSIQESRKDIFRCLIKEGASVNLLFQGRSMLHIAVKANNVSMLSFLLSFQHVEKDQRDVECRTPLMYAANGKPLCLKILLEAGCDMQARDRKGRPPFHFTLLSNGASRQDIICCLDTFLAHGADINIQNSDCETCLHKAIRKSIPWIVQWLLMNNCHLNLCVPKNCLVSHGPENTTNPHLNFSPLHYACKKANRTMVEALIACGCEFRNQASLLETVQSYRLLHQSFRQALTNVESLQTLCRKKIREYLSSNIVSESKCLNLPAPLQRYLLCIDELSLLEHYG